MPLGLEWVFSVKNADFNLSGWQLRVQVTTPQNCVARQGGADSFCSLPPAAALVQRGWKLSFEQAF